MVDPLLSLLKIVVYIIFATIGVFGNLAIVIITFKYKSLQSRCCVLIGIMAFFNLFYCIYFIQLRVMMIMEIYNITNNLCFFLSIYGIFSLNMQSMIGLFIGLDRLYSVSFPVKYSTIPVYQYGIVFSCCCILSLVVSLAKLFYLSEDIVLTVCYPTTSMYGVPLSIWLGMNFSIAVVVIFVYGGAHIKCRKLKNANSHVKLVESVNRILKSMIVVISLYVCTWFLALLVIFCTYVLKMDNPFVIALESVTGSLILCNSSMNIFIYFWRTPEYRKAILQFYGEITFKSKEASRIQVSFIPKNQLVLI
ncbi:G-protein coupled receptors family 1 profile domain-containing protein [Caenorhabditis elegans]|uniref:G-protein coupled receptors family 1 profile domain-containing protein n=1 Tax=Caenorhabditis elegans TaxID=6239 RepID=Q20156_CAEEL|nr:G-protein coupled receptors family 1 profile domain-containing protein [Caenorhabditis elegans]CCD63660.1 G-protein coupled receptors family 1 profile domain-containing protein [Caenorhabditis elegans]|eukprot:NP_505153.2 Serpentine Receptor, class SX [Caenorhabditis elegans]